MPYYKRERKVAPDVNILINLHIPTHKYTEPKGRCATVISPYQKK